MGRKIRGCWIDVLVGDGGRKTRHWVEVCAKSDTRIVYRSVINMRNGIVLFLQHYQGAANVDTPQI